MYEWESSCHYRLNRSFPVKTALKRATVTLLVTVALNGLIVGRVGAEQSPLLPTTITDAEGTAPGADIEFASGWGTYSAERKSEIKSGLIKLFGGNYEGETESFVAEVKPLIKDIVKEHEESLLAPYRAELKEKGVDDEGWIDFGAKVLNAWEKSDWVKENVLDRFQNYISREEIMEICVNQDESKVISRQDGSPGILMVNCNKRVEKAFRGAMAWYQKNQVPDIVERLTDNGVCVFSPVVYFENGPLIATFDTYGTFFVNMPESRLKELPDKVLTNILKMPVYVESTGIAYYKFMDSIGYKYDWFSITATKDMITSKAMKKAYDRIGVKEYLIYSNESRSQAEDAAERVNQPLDLPDIQASIRFMEELEVFRGLVD